MLTLEPGRYYRTRSGQKAYVAAVNADAAASDYAIGWLRGVSCEWFQDGRRSQEHASPYDLIAEWREPVKQAVELVLAKTPNGIAYVTFDRCANSGDATLARKTVELIEWEGL